ncbi:MAG: MBL fold metallo-hydrolase [Dehalococcoidia bacterium]|nr:MBL fold metallo-hydrolase [Dehalococcoidia bacterium]
MEIRILGAHVTEAADARPTSLVIDDILALDAGSLCSGLSIRSQRNLKAVLITHYHYDHVKDLPMIGMNFASYGCLDVYGIESVLEALSTHLLDGKLYPDFRQWPDSQPSLKFIKLDEYERITISGYSVMPVPVPHGVPTVGFHVTSPLGKSVFFTGDTAGGLEGCWEHIFPDLLITEMSWPQSMEAWAKKTTHLSPQVLKADLLEFRRLKGYLPRTVLIHLDPARESEVAAEVAEIARELDASIVLGREGMLVSV